MASVGEPDFAAGRVEDSGDHRHEHAVARRFRDLVIERRQQRRHVAACLAKAAERLIVLAISIAAFMPLPETSPKPQTMRPSVSEK